VIASPKLFFNNQKVFIMKKTPLNPDEARPKGYQLFRLVSVVLLVVVALGCEDQGEDQGSGSISSSPQTSSPQQQPVSLATIASLSISKEDALDRINYLFKEELEPIKPEQVQRIKDITINYVREC
jgi:hypothetical protein